MSYRRIKKRTYEILEKGSASDQWSRRVDFFIIMLIFLNILAVVLESVDEFNLEYGYYFGQLERFSIGLFTIEYLLRIWSITERKGYEKPISGRFRYLFSFYSLVDLIAVLPAYIPIFFAIDGRYLRGIRIFRLFRILKLTRYNRAFKLIAEVVRATKEELVISLFAVLTLLVIASCSMFYIEHEVQPEAFSSIPETMWWGVATLTTVGYGDVYPITSLGKLTAGIMAILGVGLFALPAGILASGFGKAIEKTDETDETEITSTCSKCGQALHN